MMQMWWSEHFKLLIKSGLSKGDLEKVVASGSIQLRDGTSQFFRMLGKFRIPLVILSSSGLGGDGIRLYLEREKLMHDGIYIVSNAFEWDEQGHAAFIKEPIIHSMNKDETIISKLPFYEKIKDRKNVILLGDKPEDIDMLAGSNYEKAIRIGFLNENVQGLISVYSKACDMVVLNDGPITPVSKLIQDIALS